jgi:hypothetical protein
MITSFAQYLLLLPSYVNILLIYAFCNLHDVSWGTKGDNGSAKDLGQVKKVEKDGKEMVRAAMIRHVLGSRVDRAGTLNGADKSCFRLRWRSRRGRRTSRRCGSRRSRN